MNNKIKTVIINAARAGFNLVEIALFFCGHKDKITHSEYLQFTKWAREKEQFYYWLRRRLNADYRG